MSIFIIQGTLSVFADSVPFLVFCNRRHCIRPPQLLNNDWVNQIRFNSVQQLKRDGIRHIYRI